MTQMVHEEAVPIRVANHDAAVARISHLPHVFAETLATVGDNGGILAQSLAAGSFKDATRVAGTRPDLVRQMCKTNASALVEALDEALELLHDAREKLAAPEPSTAELADAGYRARTRIEARSGARKESVSRSRFPPIRYYACTPAARSGWRSCARPSPWVGASRFFSGATCERHRWRRCARPPQHR